MPRAADTPAGLVAALASSDPTRPRLTWYDEAPGPTYGERIELSGRVLANWVAKAANLLQDELDVGPGAVVAVDLPPHWRATYWLLAAWSVGATVETGICCHRPDAVVTDDPEDWPGAALVAVSLPALVRAWSGPALPAGAIDEARELATYADVFAPLADPADDAVALTSRAGRWTFGELVPAARASGAAEGARLMTAAGAEDAVAAWLGPWSMDGSVVLVHGGPTALAAERVEQIAQAERVTGRH